MIHALTIEISYDYGYHDMWLKMFLASAVDGSY